MILLKFYNNDPNLIYEFKFLPKVLSDIKVYANQPYFNPKFIPMCLLFFKEYIVPQLNAPTFSPEGTLNPSQYL